MLLEGGPTLASAFAAAGLLDEVRAFVAPKVLGAGLPPLLTPSRPMTEALGLEIYSVEVVGQDLLICGENKVQEAAGGRPSELSAL
ncbi:dihydrofolate reductase family protein [Deinococcus radiophilus]|uniref:dihydrofolate reductase family protein n=1 Tax=Deinococcus radiophilus TaxID=32062 RepID=UPI003621D320